MRKKVLPLVLIFGCAIIAPNAACGGDDAMSIVKQTLIAKNQDDLPAPPKFTDEQIERIRVVKNRYDDSALARMVELHKLHRQIFDALSQMNVDRSQVLSLQSKISELDAAGSNDRVQMMLEVHDVLSVEQRQQMRKHILEHGSNGPGMRPPGLGGPAVFGPSPGFCGPPGFGPPAGFGGPPGFGPPPGLGGPCMSSRSTFFMPSLPPALVEAD